MTDRCLWLAIMAIVVSGCVIDNADYDPDAGNGADTDTDTDTDPNCQDEHHVGCNEDGDVVWFDSCDVEGDLVMDCDEEHGGCVVTGDDHAECQCDDHWDPAAGCYQCETGFAGGACAVCEVGYKGSECDACADGYAHADGECVYDDWCGSDRYWLVDGDLQSIERPDLDFDIEGTVDEPVVVDNVTGLEWKRCLEGQFWSGGTCCGVSTKFAYSDISAACTSSYAGHGDWRIPDLTELRTLLVLYPGVSTNGTIFPGIDAPEQFTSTIVPGDIHPTYLSFIDASTGPAMHVEMGPIRCVRAGIPAQDPPSRFLVAADDGSTVVDTWSGLEWRRCIDGDTWDGEKCTGDGRPVSWSAAQGLCSGSFAGHDDWSLPSITALESLSRVCIEDDPYPTAVFARDDHQFLTMWSSSEGGQGVTAYHFDLSADQMDAVMKSEQHAALCVREP